MMWNFAPWKKNCDKPRQHTKKQRFYFTNKGPFRQSYGVFQQTCIDVRVGPLRGQSAEELMVLNCGVGEYS